MASLPSRDELQSELKRRGLPRAYVARLLAELDDHYTDLLEERNSRMGAARKLDFDSQNAEQRLGKPTELAIYAADQYQVQSFFGRHPVLTFLFGPLPLLWFGLVVCSIAFFAIGYLVQAIDMAWVAVFKSSFLSMSGPEENHPFVQAVVLAIMCWGALVIPSLLAGSILCRVAARNALHWKWPAMGCGILAAIAGISWVSYQIKTIDRVGTFMVGFQTSASIDFVLTSFLPKFALAAAIGLLLMKRAQQRVDAQQLEIEA